MEIADSLQTALSQDHQDRAAAEASLNQLHQHNHFEFLNLLSLELLDDHKPTGSRQMAAIIMKNCLDAKDSVVRAELRQKWVTINPIVKDQIKDHLLKTLESTVSEARRSSSQIIAKIASVEFPRHEWHELIGLLVANITQMETNVHLKIGSIETLGCVLEEVSLEDLGVSEVDDVLTALLQSMTVPDYSFEVHLASVRALYNAFHLAYHSFGNEVKRNEIMETLGNVAVSETAELRQAAFECLVLISSLYYCHLSSHMERLLSLTLKAMLDEEEPISLQAIEFWSSICEVEIAITSDGEEYWGNGTGIFLHCHFIETALPFLVPVLLQTLLRQEENLEEFDESWNLSMAAGTCLQLVARTVGDAIIPLVTSFVDSKLRNDWRVCEACLVAFGILLESPPTEMLAGVIHRRLDMFLDSITSLNSRVRNRAAWIFGRIFRMPHRTTNNHPVLTTESLANIIHALLERIRTDVPIVANKSCTAVYFLAKGYVDSGSDVTLLTPYLTPITTSLLSIAVKPDHKISTFRSSAFEALNQIVRCSKLPESENMISNLVEVIKCRLIQSLCIGFTSVGAREQQSDLQALLFEALGVLMTKLSSCDETKTAARQLAPGLMNLILKVFEHHKPTVQEEAVFVVGSLACALGPGFTLYISKLCMYLKTSLGSYESYRVFSASVVALGDICIAIGDQILPYSQEFIGYLVKASLSSLHQSVIPLIFSCFGDIATAIRGHFKCYLIDVMPLLQKAAEISSNRDALLDDANQVRIGIFEAYSGIIEGLNSNRALAFMPYVWHVLLLVEAVFMNVKIRDARVIVAAVAVLGDLSSAFGANVRMLWRHFHSLEQYVRGCTESDDELLKETAFWSLKKIHQVFEL